MNIPKEQSYSHSKKWHLVLLAGLLVGGSLFWIQPRQVTQRNYERIRIGMRSFEVEAILGKSGVRLAAGKETDPFENDEMSLFFGTNEQFVWREKDGWIAVGFDDKGWVTGKSFTHAPTDLTWLAKRLWRWLVTDRQVRE
jgi:hypothetical protein